MRDAHYDAPYSDIPRRAMPNTTNIKSSAKLRGWIKKAKTVADQPVSFDEPPWTQTPQGELRQVGVELEMAGIQPEIVAKAVQNNLGGRIVRDSAFLTRVVETEFGEFGIELDADLLTSRKYQEHLAGLGIDLGEGTTRDQIESFISRVAGLIVPLELVGPPVPWTELGRLDEIRRRLHKAGAKGTHGSPFYAFGLQLNIEAASLEVDHLLSMLRAFLLKYEWLLERLDIDLARRVSPYVQSYPEDYVTHVLNTDYRPDIETLIDDFLNYTPTRNRPLDLLPLFAYIDENRVMAAPVEKELIKPRPAFHYRLPNCLVDEPDWNLAVPWNDWIEVERLAADPDGLEKACRDRLADPRWWKLLGSGLLRWLRS